MRVPIVNSENPSEHPDTPLGVTTLIGYERGEWVVYLEIAFPDGVRRHRIRAYRTRRMAEMAADMYRRGAMRDIPFQNEGL